MSEVKRYYVNLDHGTRYSPVDGCDQAMNKAEDFDRVTAERDALQQRLTAADELEGLLLRTNELLYAIQGDPGGVPSSAIDAMRGEVFTALKLAKGGGYE